MKVFFRILLLAFVLSSCHATLNELRTILLLGDCLSNAYEIDPNSSWVNLLSQRLKKEKLSYQIVNMSVDADTTSNFVEKLPGALKQYKPTVVIIALGASDGARGLKPAFIEKNLTTMVELAQKAQAKVLLVGFLIPTNYGPIYRNQFEKIFESVTKEHHLPESVILSNNLGANLMQADNIHPTTEGQPIIFNTIWPHLLPLLTTN